MKATKAVWITATFVLAVSALVSMSSCGGGGSTPEGPNIDALLKSGTWKVKTVTVNNTDNLSLFTGLTVTFTAANFASTNGDPVWPVAGTWTLNSATKTITRGDGLTVTVGDGISETSLTLSLTWNKTTLGGGRTTSVAGNHIFTFGK